mgnify:CR=1 FL=1
MQSLSCCGVPTITHDLTETLLTPISLGVTMSSLCVCPCVCVRVICFLHSSCSFAAFGPTNNYVTFPTTTITAPMKRLQSKESCQPPSTTAPLASGGRQEVAEDGNGNGNGDGGGDKDGGGERVYAGHVVVADRGSCMFEEKTIVAEKAGAEAVVIVNSEVRRLLHFFFVFAYLAGHVV